MDYYKVLGISKDASSEEIKKAFHRLAHKYHPHKGGDEKKFKEINEAYQILSDKEKRAQYDRFGQVFETANDSNWAWGNFSQGMPDFDLGDIFEGFPFGGVQRTKRDFKRGRDITIDMELSLEDVLSDKNKEISLRKQIVCSRCQGSGAEFNTKIKECFSCRGAGYVQKVRRVGPISFTEQAVCPECKGEGQKPENPCNVCKGEGRIRGEEDIKIIIPAGVDSNQVIKIKEKGEAGKRGGSAGDLYVRIFVKKHPVFERKGDDLYSFYPISFSQAVLGDEIDILTLGGEKMSLDIPAGTESGRIIKVSGKGIPHFSNYGRGSLYVGLIIKTPKKINKKQKELLKKIKEEGL